MKRRREEFVGERSIYKERKGWVRGEMLGQGSFASVHLATFPDPTASYFKDFPEMAAVKSTTLASSRELVMEKNLYVKLRNCPSIIKCLGDDITESEDAGLVMNVFLEYAAGGTLLDLMNKSDGFALLEPQVRRFTRSILEGIERIHREGFVHCDIKLDNVLLVEDGDGGYVAKVADLGLAKRAEEEEEEEESGAGGTLVYWAPEVVQYDVQGKPSDVWALGCVVLAMLTGELPWDQSLGDEELRKVMATKCPSLPSGVFSPAAESFLGECFHNNPDQRHSATWLLSHPFVCEPEELLDDTYDDKRPAAAAARYCPFERESNLSLLARQYPITQT